MLSLRKLTALATLLVVCCSTTHVITEKPVELRDDVLEDVCTWLITEEGFENGQKITIPRLTVGLIDIFALHILSAGETLTPEDAFADDELSAKLRETLAPVPVVPSKVRSSCSWRLEKNIKSARERNELVLELSSPLRNPYADASAYELGVFARLSVGTLGGTWYWIVLEAVDGEWKVRDIIPLDISGL